MQRALARLVRGALYVIFLALVLYVICVNWLLNSEWFLDRVNKHPDKVVVQWDLALTPFPGFVWFRNFTVRSQTVRVQSFTSAHTLYGQVDLMGLMDRTFHAYWSRAGGLQVYIRPRPREGRPYQALYPWFSPIEGLKVGDQDIVVDEATYRYSDGPHWRFILDNTMLRNMRQAWIWNYQFSADTKIDADVNFITGDKVWVRHGTVSFSVSELKANEEVVADTLNGRGEFEIDPYRPREHRGWKAMQFVNTDIESEGAILGLGFIDFYLGKIPWLELKGEGELDTRVVMAHGVVMPESHFTINNAEVDANIKTYRLVGSGTVKADLRRLSESQPWATELRMGFDSMELFHSEQKIPQISGTGLRLKVNGDRPVLGESFSNAELSVTLREGRIKQLSSLNEYLPEKLKLELERGSATISGKLKLREEQLDLSAAIKGHLDQSRIGEYRFSSDFETRIELQGQGGDDSRYSLAGSSFTLSDAAITSKERQARPWSASIKVEKAEFAEVEKPGGRQFSLPGGEYLMSGDVSDIGFINPLLGKLEQLSFGGSATVDAAFILDKGEPATGTKIQLESEDLLVGLLDQEAVGVGGLSVSITDIDENQVKQIDLQGRITDISITHSGQDRPHVEEVDLVVSAIGSGKKLTDSLSGLVADIDVSNARVTDWSAYNRYFPENGGLEFVDGEGELNASIQLSEKNTRADINLVARDLKMVIRDEHVKGDFSLDVPLRNGNLKTQSYDVGGALLQLERFGIDGAGEAENWSGRAYVESGRVRWRSPLQLKSDVTLRLDDSGPLVKLFSPDPKEHRWMQNLLSVKDVSGSAQIGIDDRSLVLNAVEIGGEDLGFLGKLRFQDNAADGMVYARYKGFHAAVEFRQGKRKWKIIGAKKHYDDYPPFAIEAVE